MSSCFVGFTRRALRLGLPLVAILALAATSACGDSNTNATATTAAPEAATGVAPTGGTLLLGGLPDQDPAVIEEIFTLSAKYLAKQTGLDVRFVPSNDYAALVTAFQRGDLSLAWFGGLTSVQARETVPNAQALVQRPADAAFHSVFITAPGVQAKTLADLKGLTFTFGSESSTSGHLMPRYFLTQAGVNPDKDFSGPPGYSGSHDKTWKLVSAGTYQSGVLNQAVWDTAVKNGDVDPERVHVLEITPPFFDYNWSIRPDVDAKFGAGTTAKIRQAFLDLNASMGPDEARLLTLFATDSFVPTQNSNYDQLRSVAQQLGIVQ